MPVVKKRKIETTSLSTVGNDETPQQHRVFTEWSKTRGVIIQNVKASRQPGRGVGLVVTQRLKQGDRILFVPTKAMVKPDIALLKKYHLETASPHVQLTMSLMTAALPEESPLGSWRATWPTNEELQESMPMFWPKDFQGLMPRSMHYPLERQVADFEKDKATVIECLQDKGWSMEEFVYYWSIVNSRSFHFKPAGSRPGYMVLCPFIDYLNHAPSGSSVEIIQNADGYEVKADRDYKPGEEIFATYGAHPNDKLLVQYGFICATNEDASTSVDDDIRLDHVILPHVPQRSQDQLQDVGYLGGYYLSPTTNEICFKTQVAVRCMVLTATEWEYFIGMAEDLGADQSKKVLDWLAQPVAEYVLEADQVLDKLEVLRSRRKTPTENAVALTLLSKRWRQVRAGLQSFQAAYHPHADARRSEKRSKR